MRKAIYFIINIFLLISCKKELTPQESSIDFSKTSAVNQTQNNDQQPNSNTGFNANNPTTATKINPPHGQPGHVCGNETQQQNVPAQSQTANNQQFTVSQTAVTTNNTNQPTAKTAKGMNPAHGQPGHRCDIAVGVPLNSKPNKATANPITVTSPTTTTVNPNNNSGTPALVSTNTATTQVAPGMNPPHGQPGHVCGIAVGSPLNQEKKTEENKTTEETKTGEVKKDN
ncbi:hypothetical protein [Flavobacterium sp. H122]|uniref:hypothetical protein n=1 Tax=Flavobacterium sp. H122 TaxID=2529860 RepID=UPI001B7D884C|nr:hypothetical protein [Flavobacterium sp. H122]